MKWFGSQLVDLSNDLDLRDRVICSTTSRDIKTTTSPCIVKVQCMLNLKILWSDIRESDLHIDPKSKNIVECLKFQSFSKSWSPSSQHMTWEPCLPTWFAFPPSYLSSQFLPNTTEARLRLNRPTWESPNHQEGISDVSIGCSMEIIHTSRGLGFSSVGGFSKFYVGFSWIRISWISWISDIIHVTSCNGPVGLRTWQPCTISPTWFTWRQCSDGLQNENREYKD